MTKRVMLAKHSGVGFANKLTSSIVQTDTVKLFDPSVMNGVGLNRSQCYLICDWGASFGLNQEKEYCPKKYSGDTGLGRKNRNDL
jgi:hypothetical protein